MSIATSSRIWIFSMSLTSERGGGLFPVVVRLLAGRAGSARRAWQASCAPPHGASLRRATVQGQERILRDRFARLDCVACGSHHRPDDMLVLAQRGSRWLILLTCWQCQRRGIFVASFPHTAKSPESLTLLDALDTPQPMYENPTTTDWRSPSSIPLSHDAPGFVGPYSPHPNEGAVTSGDVESIRHFLEGFDGDFRTLFGPSNGLAHG